MSKFEKEKIRKLSNTVLRKTTMPSKPRKIKDSDEEDEVSDIWGNESTVGSHHQRFQEFTDKSRNKVKAVINPHGGQSYNPNAKDHKEVLDQVFDEEKKEIAEF